MTNKNPRSQARLSPFDKQHEILCLSIDMIGSTAAGVTMTASNFRCFNDTFISQIDVPLRKFQLQSSTTLKFEGDGWLLIAHERELFPKLIFFALYMRNCFTRDVLTKNPGIGYQPLLRLGIGHSANDRHMRLANGSFDWVGDAVRRAVRLTQFCEKRSSQIVTHEPVRAMYLREFLWEQKTIGDILAARKRDCRENRKEELECCEAFKNEEDWRSIFVLQDANMSHGDPSYHLYLASKTEDFARAAQITAGLSHSDKAPVVHNVLQSLINLESGRRYIALLRKKGLVIDEDQKTFESAVLKAPTLASAMRWLARARRVGIVVPGEIYRPLLTKFGAPDLLKYGESVRHGNCDKFIEQAIETYLRLGRLKDAIMLAAHYPHLRTARNTFVSLKDRAINELKAIQLAHPSQSGMAYALGIAMMSLGRNAEALTYLRQARTIPSAASRLNDIDRRVEEIERRINPPS